MDSFGFDNVKAEKEDDLRRYSMEMKLRPGLQFIGFLLLLFLSSCSWFPTLIPDIVEVSGGLCLRLNTTLNEPVSVFVVLNILILVVYVLSSQKQTRKQSDIYVGSRQRIVPASAFSTVNDAVDRQIVAAENAVAITETKRSSVATIAEETTEDKQIVPVEKAVAFAVTNPKSLITSTEIVKQKEYRRTRSVLSESGIQHRRREFKRSETAMISTTERPSKSLDEMSSDEFRLIVDSFIAERRKILIQENCLSIVVKN